MTNQLPPQQPPQYPGNYPPPYLPPQQQDEIDLLELWRTLMANKNLILTITFATTLIATVAAFVMTPIYRVEVLLAPMTEEQGGAMAALAGQFGGLASLAGVDIGGGAAGKDQAIAFLKSRAFTDEFVRDNNLLPVLFYKKWDEDKQTWKVDDPEDIPTMWQAYKLFNKKIRFVSEEKKTGLITLAIEWSDRDMAAQWAKDIVQRINKSMRDRAISEAEKSLLFLNEELRKTNLVDVRQSIFNLIEGQTKAMMLANVREEYAFKVIDPPAIPDENEFEKPKRPLFIMIGFILGGMLGLFVVFVRSALSIKGL